MHGGDANTRHLPRTPQIDLAKAREKVIDLEERLERRRKTNSHKNAELKRMEDELEAVRERCQSFLWQP